ncbi:hypothetical protein VRK_07350 [Vibrio sp. MEBiC08052]|nr:hypothetical protein VRK_07350 [Vibrio sp. MEBiC08052]
MGLNGLTASSAALPGAVQVNNVQAYHECELAGVGLIQAVYTSNKNVHV